MAGTCSLLHLPSIPHATNTPSTRPTTPLTSPRLLPTTACTLHSRRQLIWRGADFGGVFFRARGVLVTLFLPAFSAPAAYVRIVYRACYSLIGVYAYSARVPPAGSRYITMAASFTYKRGARALFAASRRSDNTAVSSSRASAACSPLAYNAALQLAILYCVLAQQRSRHPSHRHLYGWRGDAAR